MGTVARISRLEFTDPEERGPFCSPSLALFLSLLYSSKKRLEMDLTQDGCMNMESLSAGLARGWGGDLSVPYKEIRRTANLRKTLLTLDTEKEGTDQSLQAGRKGRP